MRSTFPALVAVSLSLLGAEAAAQMPGDTGPYTVAVRPLYYPTTESSSLFQAVYGRAFYPALSDGIETPPDLSGGPYPHIAFLHGWTVDTTHYTLIMRQIASWGFVVTGCDTNVGFIEPPFVAGLAKDQLLTMNFLEASAAQPGDLFEGLLDFGPWGCVGHSMGGGAVFFFTDVAPRVEAAVSLTPYLGPNFGGTTPDLAHSASYTKSLMMMCGAVDTITPTDLHGYPWYQSCSSAENRFFLLIDGMGHLSPVNVTPTTEPMPAAQQDVVTYLMTTGYLRAELKDEWDLFDQIMGEVAAPEPWSAESGGSVPTFWATPSVTQPGKLAFGVAGDLGLLGFVAVSPLPASIPTVWGTLGIHPGLAQVMWSGFLDPATGIQETVVPIMSPPGTTFYLQALQLEPSGAGAVSQTIAFTVP
jgi:Chlorophyllase